MAGLGTYNESEKFNSSTLIEREVLQRSAVKKLVLRHYLELLFQGVHVHFP
jgi:hypothetical protein